MTITGSGAEASLPASLRRGETVGSQPSEASPTAVRGRRFRVWIWLALFSALVWLGLALSVWALMRP